MHHITNITTTMKGSIMHTEWNNRTLNEIMSAIFGERWEEDESLRLTPARFLKYLGEFNNDHSKKYDELFSKVFPCKEPSLIIQTKIPFRMVCEHHLLPAAGHASIGYIPTDKVLGISKLARIVDLVSTEKPSLQEAITTRIATLINNGLTRATNKKPQGVIVVTSSTHGCMSCRGIKCPDTVTSCSHVLGVFRDPNERARQEFFSLINQK